MEWWQIYLLTRLDVFGDAMFTIMFFSTVSLVAPTIMFLANLEGPRFYSSDSPEERERTKANYIKINKISKRAIVVCSVLFIIAGLFRIIIPSRQDVAVIIATHWATHNAEMQKLPDNVLKTLNGLLEKAQEKIK